MAPLETDRVNRLLGRMTLDRLFAELGPGPDLREVVKRYVFEHGPRLQRLAWIANDNAPIEQPDEAEFGDPFVRRITHQMSGRQRRAHDRWVWICGLAREHLKVWLFAGPRQMVGAWWGRDEDDQSWNLRTPALLDVIGRRLLRALWLWCRSLKDRAGCLVKARLEQLKEAAAESASGRTLAGILAAALAILMIVPEVTIAADHGRTPPDPQVFAPGGQTARFAPLA